MPPRTSWSSLVPGIIALTVVVTIVVAVLVFAGVGRTRGDTIRIHVVTTQARGVIQGTPVWVAGQRVGEVAAVDFRPLTTDTSGSVVITLRVREADAALIRRNSHIQVQSGTNIIGPMVVHVLGGTPDSPPVVAGDTLLAQSQADLAATASRLSEVADMARPILDDAKTVMARLDDPRGTIGAFAGAHRSGRGPLSDMQATMSGIRSMRAGRERSPGMSDVIPRAREALARADSIQTLLASPTSSYGRFRRDSSLGRAIASVSRELTALRQTFDSAGGTIMRFREDSAVSMAVTAARAEMTLLFEDIRKRPLRYLHFDLP